VVDARVGSGNPKAVQDDRDITELELEKGA
jgi:hypothetical protein